MKLLKPYFGLLFIIISLLVAASCDKSDKGQKPPPPNPPVSTDITADLYLSNPDGSAKFAKQESAIGEMTDEGLPTIIVNANETFQTIDGFGFSLTGGSAKLIYEITSAKQSALLEELFDNDDNEIGISYLRVSIGSSDLDEYTFSYNNTAGDVAMANFDLAYDKNYLIPILKKILSINPDIKIMGSPWSAPVWMKTNNNTIGGSLKPEYYEAYANYFVKYVQEMAAQGITIDAITVQNEPLHDGNNPSMYMAALDQAKFIKNNLGPALEAAGIATKIVIYDHNCDEPEYPISILNDPNAKQYIDGSAFHLYGGNISAMSQVHNAHPDKSLYFSEQWIGAPGSFANDLKWHTREVIIGSTRNWSKIALQWNLAADSNQNPHTEGGCSECLGGITIDGNNIIRNPAYYIIAHASKFVVPNSVRIASNYINDLPNVAFLTPEGNMVVIVLNNTDNSKTFNISYGEEGISATLTGGAVGTFVIEP